MRGGRRDRGSVFLLAMVALITLLLLGTSLVESAVQGLSRASRERRLQEAFSLAESGIDMALCKLYEDYDSINAELASGGSYSDTFTLPQGTVSYTVTAPYGGIAQSCKVVSEATSWANKRVRVQAVASYRDDVARVFEGAIFSNSPLTLNGAGGVYPDGDGKGGHIYSRGNITFNGTSFTMTSDGAIFTTGTTSWVPPQVPATHVYQRVAPIPMPVIDLDYYRSIATTVYNGKKTFTDSNLAGLSGVIYVNGDVTIAGNYSGQALIVSSGKVHITGSVVTDHPETDCLAILSTKSIQISGDATVHGLVYSHSISQDASTSISGNPEVYGAVVADVVTTNGAITVRYRDVWKGLPIPGTGKTQWAQISWEEHYL
jgi:cytoskeletal protein CcmA (bactofilin family)/Tfp pilus assembly protein PilX